MKQKGFTLMELLAVIVVLAIIAVIAIPIILNVIETSKKGALKDSAYGIIDAAELYYASEVAKGNTNSPTFTISGNKFILDSDGTTELSFKGEMPKLGNVGVDGKKTYIRITDGNYCAYKSIDDLDVSVIKGNCSEISSIGLANGNNVSGGTNPAGTIIAYYGNNAPEGYLKCDGSEYDISDYPDLAALILETTGSYGTETSDKFKVPDLRGEFLRGTGVNSHTNQGDGSSVGVHQDGSMHTTVGTYSKKISVYTESTGPQWAHDANAWSGDKPTGSSIAVITTGDQGWNNTSTYVGKPTIYRSRPTNTSILYCIKY